MTALKTGQKTYKQIAAENGRDWRGQIDDMAEVMEYGREKGIDMGGVLFGATSNEPDSLSDEGVDEGGKRKEEH